MGFARKEAPNCDLCPSRKNCFYGLLEDAASKRAWREMRIANRFRPGEKIFYEGEKPAGAYVVCTGKVKISKSNRTGQQLLTRIESPGDLLGHISLLSGWDYAGTAEAMGESVVSMIDQPRLEKFLLEHPKAMLALLKELSRDVRRGEAKARDIAFKPARARLAGTLLRASDGRAPRPVVSAFKRRELAEIAGLTVETTVRLLKDFQTDGLIEKKGKDIVLSDATRLKTLSGHFS